MTPTNFYVTFTVAMDQRNWTLYLIMLVSLACVTNTPLAQVPTPRPTRTAVATFTHTPLPPTATPVVNDVQNVAALEDVATVTPTATEAPVENLEPPTETPDTTVRVTIVQQINVRSGPGTDYDIQGSASVGSISEALGRNADSSWLQIEYPPESGSSGWIFAELTEVSGSVETVPVVDVAAPPTATPTTTPTPVPTATPLPPTATPIPASNSPIATPTNTPQPGTPGGRYEALETQGENNCSDMGVVGWVRDKGNDAPVANVIVEVRGAKEDDETAFDGPFTGVSDANGNYSIFIGPLDDVGSYTFKASVVGDPAVTSEDIVEWSTNRDCHNSDAIQVMRINWGYKN